MNGLIDERSETRAYDALEDMLDIQRHMIEATRQMDWLVERGRLAPHAERLKLRAQLDQIAAIVTEYAQQISEISIRYRHGQ
jgi:hypothetical protein